MTAKNIKQRIDVRHASVAELRQPTIIQIKTPRLRIEKSGEHQYPLTYAPSQHPQRQRWRKRPPWRLACGHGGVLTTYHYNENFKVSNQNKK